MFVYSSECACRPWKTPPRTVVKFSEDSGLFVAFCCYLLCVFCAPTISLLGKVLAKKAFDVSFLCACWDFCGCYLSHAVFLQIGV
jgi:hypothetical protein